MVTTVDIDWFFFFQVRVATCFFVLKDTNFNLREKIFVNVAWLPKATVQVRFYSNTNQYTVEIYFYDYKIIIITIWGYWIDHLNYQNVSTDIE